MTPNPRTQRAILVAAGFAVATIAATSALYASQNDPQPTAGGALPVDETPRTSQTSSSSTALPTEEATPTRGEPVDGPLGIRMVLPPGWQVTESTPQHVEAEPAGGPRDESRTFLRVGTSPAQPEDLLAARESYEQRFQTSVQNYQRIRMEKFAYARKQAVVWDFKWKEGQTERRARVVNWQDPKAGYYIYLSTPAPTWTRETDKLFDSLLTSTRTT